MDALYHEMYIPDLAQILDILLLNLVKVIKGKFPGQLRRWSEQRAIRCAAVETLQAGRVNRLAYRFASGAAKPPLLAIDFSHHLV